MYLRKNLLSTLDSYVAIRPSSGLSVYIDDLSTQSFGKKKHVRSVETQNVALLIEMLQVPPPTGTVLKVAANKGHVVSSDPKVAALTCNDLRVKCISATAPSSIRLLGFDFAGGGKLGRSTRTKCMGKVKSRPVELSIARAAGVNEPAPLYAADLNRISSSDLHVLRVLAGGATTRRAAGRNQTLDLALSGVKRPDPVCMANRAPLHQWAKNVWKKPWPKAHRVIRRSMPKHCSPTAENSCSAKTSRLRPTSTGDKSQHGGRHTARRGRSPPHSSA